MKWLGGTMRIAINNVFAVLKDKIRKCNVIIEDGIIKELSNSIVSADCVLDGEGKYLYPGVVDLHTHGSGGFDYMDGSTEDIISAAKSALTHGTTTLLPTTLTSSDEDLFLFLDNFRKVSSSKEILPNMPGVHLEGPYFDPIQKGAQDERYIRTPNKKDYSRILEKGEGIIKRWSIAPELDGAIGLMDELNKQNILISAGHTAATYEDITKAFDHGLSLLTHFYSGMNSITRKGGFRILGTIEAGYLIDDLNVEIIADGLHLPPSLLDFIFRFKDKSKIITCSDSMRAAGCGDGESILGPKNNGTKVIIEDNIAKMPDRSCFAGSIATGDTLVRTLINIVGLTPSEASCITSTQPASLIGIDKITGDIKEGKRADLILFDKDFNIDKVIAKGIVV